MSDCTHHAIMMDGPASEDRTIPTRYRCATGNDATGCGWNGFTLDEHIEARTAILYPRQPRGYRRALHPATA